MEAKCIKFKSDYLDKNIFIGDNYEWFNKCNSTSI